MIVPLKEVRGAVSGAAIAVPLRARPIVRVSTLAVGATILASCTGLARLVATPLARSSVSLGVRGCRWSFGALSIGGASGSRLHR